jgi:hypothetical protein
MARSALQLELHALPEVGSPSHNLLQETKDGVAAMVAAGLLTAAEQAVLLAP